MTTKKNEGPLTLAALALEKELQTFEELVGDLARLQVNSDKTLQRVELNGGQGFKQRTIMRLLIHRIRFAFSPERAVMTRTA